MCVCVFFFTFRACCINKLYHCLVMLFLVLMLKLNIVSVLHQTLLRSFPVLITCFGSFLQECSPEQSLPSSSTTLVSLWPCYFSAFVTSLCHLCLCYFCLNSSSWCLWPVLSCMQKLIYLCPRQTTYPMTVTISASYNEGACHVIPQSPHPFWGLVQIERRGGLLSLHQLFSSVGWVPGSVISRPDPSLFSFYCLAFSLLLFLFLN